MVPSTRTPEGWPDRCPVCGQAVKVDPSVPLNDAPCPHCGSLPFCSPTAGPAEKFTCADDELFDLDRIEISRSVLDCVPESVIRENAVLPIGESADGMLLVAASPPWTADTSDKLQFVLDRRVLACLASRESIARAILRHFGPEDVVADSLDEE